MVSIRALLLTAPLFSVALAGDWVLTFSNPSLKANEQTKPLPNPHYSWALALPSGPVSIRRSTAIIPVDGGAPPQLLSLKKDPLSISTTENGAPCDFDLLSFTVEIPPKTVNSTNNDDSGYQRFLEITVQSSTGQKQTTVITPEDYSGSGMGGGDIGGIVGDATPGARRQLVRVGGYEMGSLMIGWKRMDWLNIQARFVVPGNDWGIFNEVAGLSEEQKEWGLGDLALKKRCGS